MGNHSDFTKKLLFIALILCLTFIAGSLRFYKIHQKGLWGDDISQVEESRADLPLKKVIQGAARHQIPPLDFIILHYTQKAFGRSDFVVHLPAATWGTLSVPLLFLIISRLSSLPVAILGAIIFAFAPSHIFYSQEVRFYSLMVFSGLLLIFAFIYLLERLQSWRRWLFYLITGFIAISTHLFLTMIIAVQGLVLGYILLREKAKQSPLFVPLLIKVSSSMFLFVMLFLLYFFIILPYWARVAPVEVSTSKQGTLIRISVFYIKVLKDLLWKYKTVLLVLYFVGIVKLILEREIRKTFVGILCAVFPLSLALLFTLQNFRPEEIPHRYFIFVLPLLIISIISGIEEIVRWLTRIFSRTTKISRVLIPAIFYTLCLVILLPPAVKKVRNQTSSSMITNWSKIAEFIMKTMSEKDYIIMDPIWQPRKFLARYLNENLEKRQFQIKELFRIDVKQAKSLKDAGAKICLISYCPIKFPPHYKLTETKITNKYLYTGLFPENPKEFFLLVLDTQIKHAPDVTYNDCRPTLYNYRSLLHELNNELEKAIQDSLMAVKYNPREHWLNTRLGLLYLMANKEEEGFKYLEKGKILAEEYNLDKETRINMLKMLAEQAYWYNKFDLAKKSFTEIIALDREIPSAYYFLGLLALREEKYTEAINNFKMAVQLKPDDAEYHFQLAEAYRLAGRNTVAVTNEYKEALRLESDNKVFQEALTNIKQEPGWKEIAEFIGGRLKETDYIVDAAGGEMAQFLSEHLDEKSIKRLFQFAELLEIDSKQAKNLTEMGVQLFLISFCPLQFPQHYGLTEQKMINEYLYWGGFPENISEFLLFVLDSQIKYTIELGYKTGIQTLYYYRSLVYERYHEISKSIQDNEQAIKLNPEDFWLHIRLGLLYLKANQVDEGFSYLEKGTMLAEKQKITKEELINILQTLAEQAYLYRKYELAKKTFAKILDIDNQKDSAHYYLGMIAINELKYDVAINHLESAVKINPEEAKYHFQLAELYSLVEKDYTVIANEYKEALRLEPDNSAYQEAFNQFERRFKWREVASFLNSRATERDYIILDPAKPVSNILQTYLEKKLLSRQFSVEKLYGITDEQARELKAQGIRMFLMSSLPITFSPTFDIETINFEGTHIYTGLFPEKLDEVIEIFLTEQIKSGIADNNNEALQRVYSLRSAFYESNRNFDKAIQDAELAIKAGSKEAWVYTRLGLLYLRDNQEEKGFSMLKQGVAMARYYNPTKKSITAALMQLGSQAFRYKKYELAKKSFSDVLKFEPQVDIAYYYLGLLALIEDNYEEAVEHFEKTIRLKPQNAEYHFQLAEAYRLANRDYQVFINEYKEAVRLEPGNEIYQKALNEYSKFPSASSK